RYFVAYLGRWLSCEPLLSQLLSRLMSFTQTNSLLTNPYVAVHNNPIRIVDPDGRRAVLLDDTKVENGADLAGAPDRETSDTQQTPPIPPSLDDIGVKPVELPPRIGGFGELGPLLDKALSNLSIKKDAIDLTSDERLLRGEKPPSKEVDIVGPQQK